jgi:hypothetical protein
LLLLFAVLCIYFCGCVPVPVPHKARGVSGVEKKTVDLGFIKVGSTRQEEVIKNLSWIDAQAKDARFFVGHWDELTSWGAVWINGSWMRLQNSNSVLIEFDDEGVVRQVTGFKNVQAELWLLASRYPDPSLDFSSPIEIHVHCTCRETLRRGSLVLRPGSIAFLEDREGYRKAKRHCDFEAPLTDISRLEVYSWEIAALAQPGSTAITLGFKRRLEAGRQVEILTDLASALTFLRYVERVSSRLVG